MKYGSVCSGIEAATVAWHHLGWKAAWYSEIESYPCAVLQHHYPDTPNLGDMTKLHENETFLRQPIDLLVGGTPCQSFSVAGLRKGLADPRGNLALVFLRLLDIKRPRWVVWENVPGVLSSWSDAPVGDAPADDEGGDRDLFGGPVGPDGRGGGGSGDGGGRVPQTNDFDTFLGGLSELGYGCAWRVLDAQHFGVPQRRRRVFVVGHLGDWRPAAAVLFEPHGLSGHPAPSREARKGTAAEAGAGAGTGGGEVAHTLKAEHDASEDGTGRGTPIVIDRAAFNQGKGAQYDPQIGESETAPSLVARGPSEVLPPKEETSAVVTDGRGRGDGNTAPTLCTDHASRPSDFCPIVFEPRFVRNGRGSPDDLVPPLKAQSGETGKGGGAPVVVSLMPQNSGKDFKAREVTVTQPLMGSGPTTGNQGGDLVLGPIAFTQEPTPKQSEIAVPALDALGERRPSVLTAGAPAKEAPAILDEYNQTGHDLCYPLRTAQGDGIPKVSQEDAVRRLTPVECERLQGFRDNYTIIPWDSSKRDPEDRAETVRYLRELHGLNQENAERLADTPDGPRYKALGNSMNTGVMRWIGERIEAVEKAKKDLA
jgi:DNA (cytosine-5)-methyltransferase 1